MAYSFISCCLLLEKQPSRGVFRKRCFENIQQIYKKTPTAKCDFKKVVLQLYWNHTFGWCSPANLLYILRPLFPRNTSEGQRIQATFVSTILQYRSTETILDMNLWWQNSLFYLLRLCNLKFRFCFLKVYLLT